MNIKLAQPINMAPERYVAPSVSLLLPPKRLREPRTTKVVTIGAKRVNGALSKSMIEATNIRVSEGTRVHFTVK